MNRTMNLQWWWRLNRGKALGALAGIVLVLLIKWLGWFWAIFMVVLAVLGAAAGAVLIDSHADVDLVDE
jgi:uncharacterized membrane protein